jgi:ankyrin repeat protein
MLMKMCPMLIDQVDDKGHNPCDIAIKHGQLDVVKWLLFKTNRLVNDSNQPKQLQNIFLSKNSSKQASRRSCLHLAAKHGEKEILNYILSEMHRMHLSLDLQDLNGNTAAHLAAKYNNLDCIQVCFCFSFTVFTD